MTDHNQTPTTAQVRRNQLPLPNGDSREVNLAEFDRWLAAHDAEAMSKKFKTLDVVSTYTGHVRHTEHRMTTV
jgi:hypothetical protein